MTNPQPKLPSELPNGSYQGVLPEPQNLGDTSGLLARDGVSPLHLIIGGAVAFAIGTVLAVRWYRRRWNKVGESAGADHQAQDVRW